MNKFEDDAMELIETMSHNSHHNVEKPFRRGVMLNGQLINAKSADTGMLLDNMLIRHDNT